MRWNGWGLVVAGALAACGGSNRGESGAPSAPATVAPGDGGGSGVPAAGGTVAPGDGGATPPGGAPPSVAGGEPGSPVPGAAPPASGSAPGPAIPAPARSAFCWANAPQGGYLTALWANAADDLWAVGSPSLALHFDGARWTQAAVPPGAAFDSVWASGEDDVWLARADGAVLRGAPGAWAQTLPPGSARGWIRGRGASDVWAGRFHWNGSAWTATDLPGGSDELLRASSVQAFPLGDGTAIGLYAPPASEGWVGCARHDGTAWHDEECPGPQGRFVWASGPSDIWMTGLPWGVWNEPGNAPPESQWWAHFDGSAWSSVTRPWTAGDPWTVVAGTGPGDVWIGGPTAHFDGVSLRDVAGPPGPGATRDLAAAPGALHALHPPGVVWRGAGSASWEAVLDLGPEILVLGDVAGAQLGVARDRIVRHDGGRWVDVARAAAPFPYADLNSRLFGTSADDLWVVRYGDTSAYHWNGARWSTVAYAGDGRFWPAGSAAAGRAWFVGQEWVQLGALTTQRFRLLVHDGRALSAVTLPRDDDLWAVQAFSTGEVLAFATRWADPQRGLRSRALWRFDGSRWTEVWSDAPAEAAGWWLVPGVSRPDDVWVVADVPSRGDGWAHYDLVHWDGARLKRVAALRAPGHVRAVMGPREVWLSDGDEERSPSPSETAFLRATPDGVDAQPVLTLPALARAVWGTPAGRVYALSNAGAIWEGRDRCE